MFWLILIAVLLIVFFWMKQKAANVQSENDPFSLENYRRSKHFDDALEVAEKVKTIRQLTALETKIEKTQQKDAATDKRQQQLDNEVEKLELAYEISCQNLSYWQYILELELEATLDELNLINKKISNEEKLEVEGSVSEDGWHLIRPDDEFESLDDDEKSQLKLLIKLRTIFESKASEEDKQKKFDALVNKHTGVASRWFNKENSPYEQMKDGVIVE